MFWKSGFAIGNVWGGHFVSGQSHGALSLAQYPACTAAEPGRES